MKGAISDNQSVCSKQSDTAESCFGYLPQNYYKPINQHLARTDPILQSTVQQKVQKPILKQADINSHASVVFDLTSKSRIDKEYKWKPSIHNSQMNAESNKTYDVYPGKPRQNIQSQRPDRNPITQGDEKSLYVKYPKVRNEFAPVNQIKFF